MKKYLVLFLLLAFHSAWAVPTQSKKAVIDVAFCLDTTGSMSGLLEGAKQKIWTIVNTVASAQPKPVLRIALVAYRDRGDAYVTQKFDFTSDLETMYSKLRSFQANGGGDTPEDVNTALNDAINGLTWTHEANALKLVYLVGDAPPHMDYQEGYDYRSITHTAATRGIIINTVQCGTMEATKPIWQEIARMAEGKYSAIDQSGGMIAMASPYDAKLAELSRNLNSTYVAYGDRAKVMQEAQELNDKDSETRAPAAAAERAASKATSLYRNDSWDLVDAVQNKTVDLEKLKPADLPASMQKLSKKDQQTFLDAKAKERQQIQQQITDLSKQRDQYVQNELKKSGQKTDNAFDQQVLQSLKDEGKSKGINFQK